MTIRVIGVAIVGVALVLGGCGTVRSPAHPTPTASEEERIQDVIARVAEAQGASDVDTIAALTCAKYRDRASAPTTDDVPRMNALPLDIFATVPPDRLAEDLGKEYAGASPESVRALVDALQARDEAAYKVAMAEVMAQTVKIHVDKVENLVVDGHTATADVTVVASTGGKTTYTPDPQQITLVKEDGQWKDCTPPEPE